MISLAFKITPWCCKGFWQTERPTITKWKEISYSKNSCWFKFFKTFALSTTLLFLALSICLGDLHGRACVLQKKKKSHKKHNNTDMTKRMPVSLNENIKRNFLEQISIDMSNFKTLCTADLSDTLDIKPRCQPTASGSRFLIVSASSLRWTSLNLSFSSAWLIASVEEADFSATSNIFAVSSSNDFNSASQIQIDIFAPNAILLLLLWPEN